MIKIFTDTSANLTRRLVKQHDITVVQFPYFVDGEEMVEDLNAEFDGAAFYNAMRSGADIKTSMINQQTFAKAFEAELSAGNDIVYVGMSGGISGTARSAELAAEEMSAIYPERRIAVIDTKAASLGEGLVALHAARLASEGGSFDQVAQAACDNSLIMHQYFTVEDLKYLQKGGRISKVTAFMGNMLNVKPLLRGEDGKIVLFEKVRGRRKSLEALAQKYAELVSDKSLPVGIAHGDCPEDADKLLDKLRSSGFCGEVVNVCYEPVTGSHVGPGTVALFFYGPQHEDFTF